jgi:hypothetical protein
MIRIKADFLRPYYRSGLQGIHPRDRKYIRQGNTSIEGSIDFDAAYQKHGEPSANRWDYLVDANQHHFFEVHSGNTSDVKKVIKKYRWIRSKIGKDILLTSTPIFYWITTKGCDIRLHKRELASRHGIKISSLLVLD